MINTNTKNMFEDKIDKETVIINGVNTSKIVTNLQDNIRNVVAVKHIRTHATIDSSANTSHPAFQNVFIKLNDFNLKTAYVDGKVISCYGHLVFEGSNPSANFVSTKSNSTGIITDFNADTDNYVLNPILPQLHRLELSFINEDGTDVILKEITTEITIYTRNAKQTMF